jgi:DNA-directed RNA polymerase subunit RPC12/RpoP
MFAQLYHCSNCGRVWHVDQTEVIDTDNDEVYPVAFCSKCGREVFAIFHDGKPALHALTEEEMEADLYDDSDGADDGQEADFWEDSLSFYG